VGMGIAVPLKISIQFPATIRTAEYNPVDQ
jgi:hypothetical protein